MKNKEKDKLPGNLPDNAGRFIKLVIKKMRYRKKVRAEVMAELTGHFEDELKECTTDEQKQQKAQQVIDEFGDVKLLAVLLRRAKKRCRPLWRTIVARGFQTLGVLILCLIFYCVYISFGVPNISINYVDQANRITRPVADETLNAAPLYKRAAELYEKSQQKRWDDAAELMSERADELTVEQMEMLENNIEALFAKKYEDVTSEQKKHIEKWLRDNKEILELFIAGAQKPYYWRDLTEQDTKLMTRILMPELAQFRKFARPLCWRAWLHAEQGRYEDAFGDLLACYRLGRHLKGPRSLVEQLVGITVQAFATRNTFVIISNQQIDSQLLKGLQDKLEQLMAEDNYIMDYRVESFIALDFIQRCYTDNGAGSGHMIPGRIKEHMQILNYSDITEDEDTVINQISDYANCLAISLGSPDRCKMKQVFEEKYRIAQDRAHKTPWQLRQENVDLEMELEEWSFFKRVRYWPYRILISAFSKLSQQAYANKVGIEAALTTVAILRYDKDRGDYPQNLAELIEAGFLKELPMDPFSDKPLVYKKTDDGFLLYGVGRNFKDDGGEVYKDDQGRVRQWGTEDRGDRVFWPVVK